MKKMKPEAWGQDIKRAMDLLKRTKENKLRREFTMEENLLICHCIVKYEWFAYEFFFKTLTPMMKGFVNTYGHDEYCELAGHGFRILAEAVELGLPYDIDCPALLICGEKDAAGSTKRYNHAWAKGTGLPLAWIKGAGHNSNTDRPDEINALIAQFIGV